MKWDPSWLGMSDDGSDAKVGTDGEGIWWEWTGYRLLMVGTGPSRTPCWVRRDMD